MDSNNNVMANGSSVRKNSIPASSRKVPVVMCMAAFLVPFMGSSLNLALPQISEAFSFNVVTLTWMATAYLIATAIFQIP